jgi:hypothetical protein
MVGEGSSESGMGGEGGEMSQQAESGRVRAWVMAKADDPAKAAKNLWEEKEGGDKKHMIVRADVVRGAGPKNIVVPVDAADEGELQDAVIIIKNETDDNSPTLVRVTKLYPNPPGGGRDPSPDEDQIVGRNAWG